MDQLLGGARGALPTRPCRLLGYKDTYGLIILRDKAVLVPPYKTAALGQWMQERPAGRPGLKYTFRYTKLYQEVK